MEKLLYAIITEDGSVQVMTDFESPEAASGKRAVIDRGSFLFQSLVSALREARPECLYVIQLLEAARREARLDSAHIHPELEAALLQWRRKMVAETGYSAFIILSQRVLLRIADSAPRTKEELLAIPGFGPGKFASYGKEILEVIKAVNPA